jgi:outer membrane immunogenic protein
MRRADAVHRRLSLSDVLGRRDLAPFHRQARAGRFGFGVGAQFGYNYQMQQIVVGFEADLDWGDGARSTNFVAPPNLASLTHAGHQSAGREWLGTARLRAGYAFDRALIFASGGLAYGGVRAESSASLFDGSNTDDFAGSASGTKVGYTLGGGVECAFAANMSLTTEHLRYDLGKGDYAVAAANTIAQGEEGCSPTPARGWTAAWCGSA